jgi:hypothetical protein
MRAPLRSGFAVLWLALAMPFLGCAQWIESSNSFRSRGEIQGRVEILAGALASRENIEKSNSAKNQILVFLEPITPRFSLSSLWQVQKVAIQTSRHSSGIQLVTVDRPIRIQNLDSVHHELFTTNTDNPLRIQLAGESESEAFRLPSTGLVRLYCALHPDENHTFVASSSSTDHAFVDSSMRFRIPHVRPGRYRVRAASALDWGQPETVEIVTAETVWLTLRLASGQSR